MKQNNLGQIAWLILLVLLLAMVTVMPAAAQGPDDEEGDVSVQVGFATLAWNPPAGINVPVGGASAINRVNITQAFEATGFVLEIGYDAAVVTPDFVNVRPGTLLPGVANVDYFFRALPMATAPGCAAGAAIPAGLRITVAYFNLDLGLIEGSGPLVEIPWRHAGGAGPSFLCVDPANSKLVDQQGVQALFPLTLTAVFPVAPINQFRIGLQGGKFSNLDPGPGSAPFQIPAANVVNVTVNGAPCIVTPVPPPPADGHCSPGFPPPYDVVVQRPGYLDVNVNFATSTDVRSIYMLAGDLNNDNQINILDMVNMAILLNAPPFVYNGLQAPGTEQGDFTGPGFIPNGVVDISDLVLVARNFGRSGPTNGSGGEF
jgi:hypothetical protein